LRQQGILSIVYKKAKPKMKYFLKIITTSLSLRID
jgi:hypothetical protein